MMSVFHITLIAGCVYVVSLVRSLQIAENGSENPIVRSLSSMCSQYKRLLATNPQLHRKICESTDTAKLREYFLRMWFSCSNPQKQAERKTSQVHSNLRYRLWFATKSPPEHQRVEVHRNSPQKRTQRVEKPPGILKFALETMIGDEIAF